MGVRKDSKMFLKKLLEYSKEIGKYSFVIKYNYFDEIPCIETAVNAILKDLIENNCLTSHSKIIDLEGNISINITQDGLLYFEKEELKEAKVQCNFNMFGGQANLVFDNGTVYADQNNGNEGNDNINNKSTKFQNNKKEDYIKNWNSRLFLHQDNDKRPITLADAFIMPDYYEQDDYNGQCFFSSKQSLEEKIDNFVSDLYGTSTMLITGVPGVGKSSMISWIANRYKDCDRVIILRFRDWEYEELDKGLLRAICNTFECKKKDLEEKVLILDGFDEIKALNIRDKLLNDFFTDIKDFDNFKCIITSRPAYIDEIPNTNILELKEFDIKKVERFFQKITGNKLNEKENIESNLEVLGIPVILYMAIMSKVDINENLTKPELYNRIFAEKGGIFDRFFDGVNQYSPGSQIMRNPENIKEYLKFLREVAIKMFEKNSLVLLKDEYKIPKLQYQGDLVGILEFPIKHLFENTPTNIEFIHKSIYEYFVAEYICGSIMDVLNKDETIEVLAGLLGSLLIKKELTPEIIEFLKYKIRNGKLSYKFDIVNEAFQLMLQNGMTYYMKGKCKNVLKCEISIFKNMLGFLQCCESFILSSDILGCYIGQVHVLGLNLRKADLRGANLVEADLREANLVEANLKGADLCNIDLRMANLKGANLCNVNLSGADLREAILREVNLEKADLNSANLCNVDLTGANLSKSDLRYANLSGVDMSLTILDGAIFDEEQVNDLENECDLNFINIYRDQTVEIITYKEYCETKNI